MKVDSSIYPYSSTSFCIMWFDALLLGLSALRMFMSSWRVNPFIIIQCPSLSLIIFLALKLALSKIHMATLSVTSHIHIYVYIYMHSSMKSGNILFCVVLILGNLLRFAL